MFAMTLDKGQIVETKEDPQTGIRSTDWRATAANYAVQQGPAFVLLSAILAFLGYAVLEIVPQHLEAINKGYEKNAIMLKENVDVIVKSHEKDRELFEKIITERRGSN